MGIEQVCFIVRITVVDCLQGSRVEGGWTRSGCTSSRGYHLT